jgi:mono/diheme cytochrome c family protein
MFGKLNLLLVASILLCLGIIYFVQRDPSEPNYELIPERQMSLSPAYETYAPNPNFPDGITFRQPAPGTISRGSQPFAYGPTPTEMVRAGKELSNPLSFGHPDAKQRGAVLYANYCQFCHGPTGNGDGQVSGRGFPAPLSFLKPQALDMKDGEMFHILTYGKGNMPAHAVQLSPEDRWALVLYVRVLQNKFTEYPNVRLADMVQVFKANCMACHGEDGAGALLRDKLPNLPDFSSLAWQFSKTNLEISNRIEYGDEPLMPTFRYRLSRDQILGLAIYIRSFAVKDIGAAAPKPTLPPTAAGLTPVQIFRAYCLACHNVDGRGAIVRPGMPDIPDFTVASWHTGKKDDELSKAILSGGKFMPPMKDKLTPENADKMVHFIRAFQDGKQVVALESPEVPKEDVPIPKFITPEKAPPVLPDDKTNLEKPPVEKTSPDIANRLRAAGVLFREYCIVCHGTDGKGVAAMRAALPPLPDFTRPNFHKEHSDPQLLISILDGKGALMPANRGRLNESQGRDLVAFVRAFGPVGSTSVASPAPNEFQKQFEQLQRQFEALQQDLGIMKKAPPKQ